MECVASWGCIPINTLLSIMFSLKNYRSNLVGRVSGIWSPVFIIYEVLNQKWMS